jgi:CIC family chloride channel protein
MSWGKVLIVKFSSGIFALGCGLLLGKEGPMLQIGGAVGDGVSEKLKLPAKERRTMITAGIGAGLAAAFNAPLTGLSFVLEEVQHDFQPIVFATAFIASMVANIVARYFGQGELIFSIPITQPRR